MANITVYAGRTSQGEDLEGEGLGAKLAEADLLWYDLIKPNT